MNTKVRYKLLSLVITQGNKTLKPLFKKNYIVGSTGNDAMSNIYPPLRDSVE